MVLRNRSRTLAGLVAVALSMTACAGGARRATSPSAAEGLQGQGQPAAPTVAGGPMPTPSRVATLNSAILSRTTPPSPEDDLPLGTGDLIVVSVFLVSELSQLSVRLSSNGNIALPLIGVLPAAGHTARELENEIKARLQRYMHDPQVSVFIQEHKSQQIAVFGSVKNGGVYPLVSHLRVTDALAMAGALNDDADHTVYLIRRSPARAPSPAKESPPGTGQAGDGESMIPIDLESVIAERADLNLPLQAGDIIHVPRAGSYYVGGDVTRPGSFLLKGKTTLHQAVVSAGGVKPTADWDDVRVYRPQPNGEPEVLKFSLNDIEERPGLQGIEIKKNDVVIVGKSGLKVFGLGVLDFIRFGFGATIP